jgi:hypothetical protein
LVLAFEYTCVFHALIVDVHTGKWLIRQVKDMSLFEVMQKDIIKDEEDVSLLAFTALT